MDSKSIIGSICTVFLAGLSKLTLEEWAAIAAIITGAVTTAYTLWKWYRDYRKK